jgi:hypothetical protein
LAHILISRIEVEALRAAPISLISNVIELAKSAFTLQAATEVIGTITNVPSETNPYTDAIGRERSYSF